MSGNDVIVGIPVDAIAVDLRSATEQDVELLKAAINTTHSVELNHDGDEKIETIQTLVMNRRTVQDSVTGIDFEKSAQDIRGYVQQLQSAAITASDHT